MIIFKKNGSKTNFDKIFRDQNHDFENVGRD